jgi:hypothetical protein
MNDLERRLRHAVTACVGGDRPAVTCAQVGEALEARLGITAESCSVHPFHPEDFIIVLASAELRGRVLARSPLEHEGFSQIVRPWNRLAQATKVNQRRRVQIVMEGVPPHAWERETAEELLGTSCTVEELSPATRSRADMSLFRLSAWVDNLEVIPSVRTLVVPEPEEVDESSSALALRLREEVATLRYRVLIHVDSVEEDWDPRASRSATNPSGGGHDGSLPQERLGDGGRTRRRVHWKRSVPDRREHGGDDAGTGSGAGRRSYKEVATASLDWRILAMEERPAGHVTPEQESHDKTVERTSLNDLLTGQEDMADSAHREPGRGRCFSEKTDPPMGTCQITYTLRSQKERAATKSGFQPLVTLVEEEQDKLRSAGVGIGGAEGDMPKRQ